MSGIWHSSFPVKNFVLHGIIFHCASGMVGSQHIPQLSVLSTDKESQGIITASFFSLFYAKIHPRRMFTSTCWFRVKFSSLGVLTDPWAQLLKPQCGAAFSMWADAETHHWNCYLQKRWNVNAILWTSGALSGLGCVCVSLMQLRTMNSKWRGALSKRGASRVDE